MLDALEKLEAAVVDFRREADYDFVDPRRLAAVVDGLQGELATVVHRARRRGDHLLTGQSPSSWVASTCRMSKTAASGRLCVGEQLESMPKIAEALSSGEIGYQATSVICHLQERVNQVDSHVDQEMWIGFARESSVKDLSDLAARLWYALDPKGFSLAREEDFERRQLFISESGGMFRLDGWLDPEGGAALKTAIDSLAKPLGSDDQRTARQRRADALTELTHMPCKPARCPGATVCGRTSTSTRRRKA